MALTRKRPRQLGTLCALSGVALLGIAIRIALLTWGPKSFFDKTWEYEEIARHILEGQGFWGTYLGTPYQAPVHPIYPWFCAMIYRFAGGPSAAAVQWVQIALIPLFIFVAYQIGKELAHPRIGVLTSLGVVLHPGLLMYSLRLHALWLDSLCFLTILWLTLRVGHARPPKKIELVALGCAMGWGLLGRSTIAVAFPVILGWLLWRWKGQPRRLHRALLVLIVSVTVSMPWAIRNWIVLGKPTLSATSAAFNLWLGNFPGASGSTLDHDGKPLMEKLPPSFLEKIYSMDEMEQHAFFYQEAWAAIRADPGLAARRLLDKWWQFWMGSSRTGAWYPLPWRLWYQRYYLLLWLGVLAGGYVLWKTRHRSDMLLILLYASAIGLGQSIFFVEGRHRWEIESFLVAIAACGAGLLFQKTSRIVAIR